MHAFDPIKDLLTEWGLFSRRATPHHPMHCISIGLRRAEGVEVEDQSIADLVVLRRTLSGNYCTILWANCVGYTLCYRQYEYQL